MKKKKINPRLIWFVVLVTIVDLYGFFMIGLGCLTPDVPSIFGGVVTSTFLTAILLIVKRHFLTLSYIMWKEVE